MESEPVADLAVMSRRHPSYATARRKVSPSWVPMAQPGEGVKQGCKQNIQLGNYMSKYMSLAGKPPRWWHSGEDPDVTIVPCEGRTWAVRVCRFNPKPWQSRG